MGRGDAGAVAIELACRLSGQTQRAIGAYFGGIRGPAVCRLRAVIGAERHDNAGSPRLAAIVELERRLLGAVAKRKTEGLTPSSQN
jgi:hypothetical protein